MQVFVASPFGLKNVNVGEDVTLSDFADYLGGENNIDVSMVRNLKSVPS